MTELGLRPRSSTELVDAAFQVFRRDPVPFIVATAVFYVPWLLIQLTVLDTLTVSADVDWSRLLPNAVFSLFVYAAASGVAMRLASDVYLGRPTDLAATFRTLASRIPTLIETTLITFVLTVIAAMFFFLPALYPLARFFAVRQSIVIEDAGLLRSLSRSSELSVGVKRHVLSALILAGLIVLAISVGSRMVSSMIPSRVLLFAISTAVSVLAYPFLAIVQTLLYYDVRIRKEGFDIEFLASGVPLDASADVGG